MQVNLFRTDNLRLLVIGLCPLSLFANSTVNSMTMGIIFFIVILLSSIVLAVIKNFIPHIMRMPMLLMVIACIIVSVDMLVQAFYYEQHLDLGVIYVPLLSMNCLLVDNAEGNVFGNNAGVAISQGVVTGLGVWGILLLTGIIKDFMVLVIFSQSNFVAFNAAPNTFLVLGLIIAAIQYLNIVIVKEHD